MSNFLPIGERLREERERLGKSQAEFAEVAGVTRKTLFGYESGVRTPDAGALASWGLVGIDVLYVVTGQRLAPPMSAIETGRNANESKATHQSNVRLTAHLTETTNPVTNANDVAEIDEALMRRIVMMLAKAAKAAGRRWESERLMLAAVDVYKFLAKEEKVDDAKLERVLKLVVNR
ncbi:MAG TPA: helix-turn-helix transcriptional regulator [Pseudomonas sp.]|nr:helix-turn-helix transcriptional regulator [Pseudomonas sp.]